MIGRRDGSGGPRGGGRSHPQGSGGDGDHGDHHDDDHVDYGLTTVEHGGAVYVVSMDPSGVVRARGGVFRDGVALDDLADLLLVLEIAADEIREPGGGDEGEEGDGCEEDRDEDEDDDGDACLIGGGL